MHTLVQRRAQPSAMGWMQSGLVITAVTVSAGAHAVAAAAGPAGPMSWWMAAMAVLCLACAAPMRLGRRCTSRAAEHLLAMGAAMILIHLAVLAAPTTGSHHGAAHGGGTSHGVAMLALLGVELLCLILASVALRLGQISPSPHVRRTALPLPTTHAIH